MITMQKPSGKCYVCGTNDWWQLPDGGWLCNQCHPNPNPSTKPVASPGESQYSSEVLALRDRVKAGNDKLTKAWLQILEIAEMEERSFQDERWYKARDKLYHLCLELQAKGYEDCLYIVDGKKTRLCPSKPDDYWCWVCPAKVPYWRSEGEDNA